MLKRAWQSVPTLYQHHSDFILLLILFTTFRILALAAYRPGGLVLDFSDFYWYRSFAELTRQGYYPYDNLWTTYPPLFPAVMIYIFQLSSLLPPWDNSNLWFSLLLGGFFQLFEIGNFILLYLFALKLYAAPSTSGENASPTVNLGNQAVPITVMLARSNALRPCWIYAALFIPVYTLTGWFESYPLFFFLLSLYLLLQNRPYLSAFFTGIGFMIKLIPVLLIPIAVQLIAKVRVELRFTDSKLQVSRMAVASTDIRTGQSDHNPQSKIQYLKSVHIPFDVPRTVIYFSIFMGTIIAIALPFYTMNPDLFFGPQQITQARPPWETVWALIDGNYDYGVIPLDMRNLRWTAQDSPPSQIPWLLVTGLFGLLYAAFYTRPIAWKDSRNALAFVGFTLALFMLWSKGYSPQWLGWPLFFIALLLPNLRGIVYATILSLANIIEANFYFIIFPEERWLFATTVLLRTFLLIVLAIEFLWLIWPQVVTPRVEKIRAWGVAVFVTLLIVSAVPIGLQLSRSYFDLRQRQSPYSATINRLQDEQVTGALLLNSHATYDWFYPYLRYHGYSFFMLDDYILPDAAPENRTVTLLNDIASQTDVLWIFDADASTTTHAESVLSSWLGERPPAHIQDIDGGRLYLYILK